MNCVLYARVSTDKQADKDLSIPAQLQAMQEFARRQGWSVVREFIEPGASARTAQRPVLAELLATLRDENSDVQVVVVHKIDRLARNVYDHATIRALFKQRGIQLASVVEPVDDSVSGQLVENIMASIAQFYSANLADEVRKGMRQKVLNGGWPHQPPRGYVVTGAEGRKALEVHPREGALVRRAFEWYASGAYSLKGLARRLAQDGLTAKSGRPIAISYLRRMLTNGFYAGRLKWKELDVRGSHPPLVSSDLYAKVAKVLSTRYRDAGVKGSVTGFPLRGLAICSTCRSRMTAERHGQWGYYRCGRNAFQSAACRAKFCNATRAHRDLEGICQQIRITQDARNAILKTLDRLIRDRVSSAERSQRHLENQETALIRDELRLTEAFTSGDMSPDVYKVRSADLRLRRTRLASDRARGLPDPVQLTAKAARILDVATSLRDFHDTFSNDERASLFRDVFSTIVISSEGIVGYTLRKPFNELVSSAKNDPRKLSVEKRERLAKAILNAA